MAVWKGVEIFLMSTELSRKVTKGFAWNSSNQIVQQIVQFAVIVFLARILRPSDFGLFSMSIIFVDLIRPFRQWGFQAFLIQKNKIDDEYNDTAFWSMCILGSILYFITILTAPMFGAFFDNREVARLVSVIGIIFLLSPFGAVQWALLNRDLNFKIIAIRDVVVSLIYGVTVIILALKGFGVWALIIASIFREALWSFLFWIIYEWRPRFRFSFSKMKEMLGFSSNCMGTGLMNYFINNIDNILVGKYLGATNLGVYNLAFNTVSHPQTKFVTHITTVTFPALSSIKEDIQKFKDYYLKMIKIVLIIALPILSVLFVSSKDFVRVLYGEKWISAAIPIQIMCFYGLIRALSALSGTALLSKGRPDIDFRIGILRLFIFGIFLAIGLSHGVIGVSLSVLAYSIVNAIVTFYVSNKILNIDNLSFYKMFLKYVVTAIFLTIIIFMMKSRFYNNIPYGPSARLLINFIFGFLLYYSVAVLFFKNDIKILSELVKKIFKNR